jgi:hypothetical protein
LRQNDRKEKDAAPNVCSNITRHDALYRGVCHIQRWWARFALPTLRSCAATKNGFVAAAPSPSLRAKRSNPSRRERRHGLLRRFAPRNDAGGWPG